MPSGYEGRCCCVSWSVSRWPLCCSSSTMPLAWRPMQRWPCWPSFSGSARERCRCTSRSCSPRPSVRQPPVSVSISAGCSRPRRCSSSARLSVSLAVMGTRCLSFPLFFFWDSWLHGMPGKTHHMPHINLGNDLPGIRGLMAFRPETARPLNELAEQLLRDDDNTLSRGERELIGTYVSSLNDCFFCQNVHGSLAQHYLECDMPYIDAIKRDPLATPISDKMKALLSIAASVQKGGRQVRPEQIEAARAQGATDR